MLHDIADLFSCGAEHWGGILYYWCPVNASSSMNINLFEWYNPHSLHVSPKRGLIH